jgi:hypothetical protein
MPYQSTRKLFCVVSVISPTASARMEIINVSRQVMLFVEQGLDIDAFCSCDVQCLSKCRVMYTWTKRCYL